MNQYEFRVEKLARGLAVYAQLFLRPSGEQSSGPQASMPPLCSAPSGEHKANAKTKLARLDYSGA